MIPAPKKVTPLTSGQSNQTLRLESDSTDVVLKRWQNDDLFKVDRRLEVSIQKTLADIGVAPGVLGWNDKEGWLLQPYLQAPSLSQERMPSSQKATVLAEVLATVHACRPTVQRWHLNDKVEHYLHKLATYNEHEADLFRQEKPRYQPTINRWLEYPVLCHNDLSMNHILMTTPVTIIDWEYAGIGHPLFDIANTIVMNKLDKTTVDHLLDHYEQRTEYQVEWADIAEWVDLVDWLNNLWQHLLSHSQ